jgi:hypothetical protein
MILINPNTQQEHKVNVFLGSIEGFQSLGHFGGFSYPTLEQSNVITKLKWKQLNLSTNGNNTLFFNFEKLLCYTVDSSG